MGERGNTILRWADQFLGIPLVYVLGLLRKKKSLPKIFRNVGILAIGAIGDGILLSPVIRDFITSHKDTQVTVFCSASNSGVFRMFLPDIHQVTLPITNPMRSVAIIRKKAFDLFLDFGPWPRINAVLSWFSLSGFRVGFQSIAQYRHYAYELAIPHRNNCHEIENMRRLIEPFGVKSASLPDLGDPSPNRENPYVAVHMFPSGYMAHYKEWSDEKWVTLLDGLTDSGYKVYLTGAAKDYKPGMRILNQCRQKDSIRLLAGQTNLNEAACVIQKALLVVSVNTGIMHLAAAFKQNLIALHGPTSPLRWGPLCGNALNFMATTPGAGSLHFGFEYRKNMDRTSLKNEERSLDSIDAQEVLSTALKRLK